MGRTKALVEIDGVAMADRVLGALRAVGAAPVVVYGGDADELTGLSAPVIADEFPGEGPVGGVLGALNHFASAVFVLPCDVAMVDRATLVPLVETFTTNADRVVVARTDRIEPMCAIWPVGARAIVAELFESGERALHRVVERVAHVVVDVEPRGLANFNAPGDLTG